MVRYPLKMIALAVSPQLYQNFALAIDTSNCEPVANLGSDNVDRYSYSSSINISDNCDYTLDIKFKHDESLPIPSSGSQCDPSIVPPAIASDNLPYFAFRWAYESFSKKIKDATGLDHISIDFNPCGHPPMDVFTIPHYDLHLYKVSPEFRTCMTCDKIPGAPVCDPGGQSTSNGKAFLNVGTIVAGPDAGKISNFPDGFEFGVADMVPLMGTHSWDVSQAPINGNSWVEPVWVMGTYDGNVADVEPMIPLSFMTGNDDKSYEETLTYVGQTMNELPNKYHVSYDSESGFVTFSMEGQSSTCNQGGAKTKKSKGKKAKKKAK